MRAPAICLTALAVLLSATVASGAHAEPKPKPEAPPTKPKKPVVVRDTVPGTIQYTVQNVFERARENDFEGFLNFVHPDAQANEKMRKMLFHFSWKYLVQRVHNICDPKVRDRCVYQVTREHQTRDGRFKLFVKKDLVPSMPCPMVCRKDGANWGLMFIGCI